MTAAIRESYSVHGKDNLIIHSNPHSVQGGLVMWAEFASEEICGAATWSTPCTFAHHYWLDLTANFPNFATQL